NCIDAINGTHILVKKGSVSDSRILNNALRRKDNLIASQDINFLHFSNARYILRSSFITPYRNIHQSSLHNVIERAFGIVKNRCSIIAKMAIYDVNTVSKIVVTCCILHNFLMNFYLDEAPITQVKRDLNNSTPERNFTNIKIVRGEDGRMGENLRDSIAAQM
ncbi:hypothetical protein HN51_002259, partial [Arachis hypogaea]